MCSFSRNENIRLRGKSISIKSKYALVLILITFIFMPSAYSTAERELNWEDLIPNSVKFDDPFATLSRENLEYLGFVARIRNMIAAGKEVSKKTLSELNEIEAELVGQGIDSRNLLARLDEIRQLRKKSASAVVEELNGSNVRMPGYLLPLEFSGRKITEFLLVPWVGACIHTPPPPPNQIIHVSVNKKNGYESRSMYEPVWVSGRITLQEATKNLFLKDGSSDILIGYSMKATAVEKYKR